MSKKVALDIRHVVETLLAEVVKYRAEKNYSKADHWREKIESRGWRVYIGNGCSVAQVKEVTFLPFRERTVILCESCREDCPTRIYNHCWIRRGCGKPCG